MSRTVTAQSATSARSTRSLHQIGVICGLAAGAWLGTAEAPTKLVTTGISPFVITLGMVLGVFVARWTLPMLLKGAGFLMLDLREKAHLMVWAVLAGVLWSIANTLTVFAIRNVGLSIAFPLWNTNCLVGLFWGWLLFNELRGAGAKGWAKVLGGSAALVAGASILAYATASHSSDSSGKAMLGVLAALGAGVLWGTMYIPYRKAYISGMNPLSFVTIFTFGELGATLTLGAFFRGGIGNLLSELSAARPVLFWLFLGGFCWVIGDLFQQYAAKYIGIGRGIPLSNTNQLWGLAWGALVFGELTALTPSARLMVLAGSAVMIAGAAAIGMAAAPESELANWKQAMQRECDRYGMDPQGVAAVLQGEDPTEGHAPKRRWWEGAAMLTALGIFVWLALGTRGHSIPVDMPWMILLLLATMACLGVGGTLLWRRTRFS
jgi:drug/metabolite transporter (DMT)-like permease